MVFPGRPLALHPSRRHFARRRGFTLVEILVVIAIIAILAAIILPAIAGASKNALQTTSISNLKQWHVGFAGSIGENNNEMPSDGAGDFKISDETAWFNRMPPHIQVAPLKAATQDHIPKMRTKSVWINPGAPPTVLAPVPFCYGYNDYLSTEAEPTMKVTRVTYPTKTVLMAEKLPDGAPSLNPTNIRSYYGTKDPLDQEAVCDVLFLDGHVEGVKRKVFAALPATSASTEGELREAPFTWQPYENANP